MFLTGPRRTLTLRRSGHYLQGDDVAALQASLNRHLARHANRHPGDDQLAEDGVYGPATRAAYRWVGWYVMGFTTSALRRGATEAAQQLIHDPSGLSDAQRERAKARQRRLDIAGPAQLGYPLGQRAALIGIPGVGTHSWHVAPHNWQSDRAIDLGVAKGTRVYAVAEGVIGSQFGPLGSSDPRFAGLRLYVNTNSNSWYYAHLDSAAAGIRPGVRVRQGQLLGTSGVANGVPHLHLACQHGDPRTVL
jgi:murein DD-endopeptidase MepM/ murein hydrolase activator NlpD